MYLNAKYVSVQIKNNACSGEWYSDMIRTGTIEYIIASGSISTYLMVKVPLPINYTSTFLVNNLKSFRVSVSISYDNGHIFRGIYVGTKKERNTNWGKEKAINETPVYTFYNNYSIGLKGYFGSRNELNLSDFIGDSFNILKNENAIYVSVWQSTTSSSHDSIKLEPNYSSGSIFGAVNLSFE